MIVRALSFFIARISCAFLQRDMQSAVPAVGRCLPICQSVCRDLRII